MDNPNIESTRISKDDALETAASWNTCLPGNLSNLFYFIGEDKEDTMAAQRYDNYFFLGSDGIEHLLHLDLQAKPTIRVYMGCHKVLNPVTEEAMSTFSPFLYVGQQSGSGQDGSYYKLRYHQKTHRQGRKETHITAEIAELFRTNWDELSEMEVADAFTGITMQNINAENKVSLITRRVKSYSFKADVVPLVTSLREIPEEDRYVRLFLGAGLTVRVTHPFNFRPILAIPSTTPPTEPMAKSDPEAPYQTYFERSRPCPPYCPDE